MLERYMRLSKKMDAMVDAGMNSLNPIIRSIGRQLWKIYQQLTPEERQAADFEDNIYFS